MPRRAPKKIAPVRKQSDPIAELGKVLVKHSKAELVSVLVELARDDRGVLRQLTARFEVPSTARLLLNPSCRRFGQRFIERLFGQPRLNRCIPHKPRHAVKVGVVAGDLRQALALHYGDNKGVAA